MADEVHKAKADVLKDLLSGMFKDVPLGTYRNYT